MGRAAVTDAIEHTVIETGVSHDLADYMERLVRGIYADRRSLDPFIEGYLQGYELERLAAVDRNIIRIGTYELMKVPEMPPAVAINEAIEIAKRYSTAESGKFVNGVLGRILRESPKANWDPATAPPEYEEEEAEEVVVEEIVEETVSSDSQEGKDARRFGWVLKSGDRAVPKLEGE